MIQLFYRFRGLISLILLGLGIAAFFVLEDLIAVFAGPILIVFAMAVWTLPIQMTFDDASGPIQHRPDSRLNRWANYGLIGGSTILILSLVALFLPQYLSTLLILTGVAIFVGYVVWLVRR